MTKQLYAGYTINKFYKFTKSCEEIVSRVKGKTVTSVELDDAQGDDFLIFHFNDNSTLRIRYDWLYEWQFIEGKNE